jgi:hypothetical protein
LSISGVVQFSIRSFNRDPQDAAEKATPGESASAAHVASADRFFRQWPQGSARLPTRAPLRVAVQRSMALSNGDPPRLTVDPVLEFRSLFS